jgi:hypothetical protein
LRWRKPADVHAHPDRQFRVAQADPCDEFGNTQALTDFTQALTDFTQALTDG